MHCLAHSLISNLISLSLSLSLSLFFCLAIGHAARTTAKAAEPKEPRKDDGAPRGERPERGRGGGRGGRGGRGGAGGRGGKGFDRHSRRGPPDANPREEKKGGHGTWGSDREAAIDEQQAEKLAQEDATDAVAAEATEETATTPEPEEKFMTLEEYQQAQAEKRRAAAAALPAERKPGEGEKKGQWKGEKLEKQGDEELEEEFFVGKKANAAKTKARKQKNLLTDIDVTFGSDKPAPRPERGERTERGRGAPRKKIKI